MLVECTFICFLWVIYSLLFLLFLDDHSRVHLSLLEGIPDSDFINASYINVSPSGNGGGIV